MGNEHVSVRSPDGSDALHVVAAAIIDRDNRVLIARRTQGQEFAGHWEFPGGKLENGETPYLGLAREIREELGIEIERAIPLIQIHHRYAHRSVYLDVWCIDSWRGEASPREGQTLSWTAIAHLNELKFPDANRSIPSALRLPRVIAITGERAAESFDETVNRITELSDCTEVTQLRAPSLAPRDYSVLAEQVLAKASNCVMLNSSAHEVVQQGAAGLHLTSRRLMATNVRPIDAMHWLSASVHNLGELEAAAEIDVDFVYCAPVKATLSHPGAPHLGWSDFAVLAERAPFPVYALGGLSLNDLPCAIEHGAQGIAMISGMEGYDDPATFRAAERAALEKASVTIPG